MNEINKDLIDFKNKYLKKWNDFMIKRHGKKFARRCDECTNCFNQGYVIDNGIEYYCSKKCLNKHYSDKDFNKMYDEGKGDSYYTEWECEEDFQYYEDGTEIMEE